MKMFCRSSLETVPQIIQLQVFNFMVKYHLFPFKIDICVPCGVNGNTHIEMPSICQNKLGQHFEVVERLTIRWVLWGLSRIKGIQYNSNISAPCRNAFTEA